MQQLKRYNRDGHVYKLNRNLYGLKQTSKCWNRCFIVVLKKHGLASINADHLIKWKRSEPTNSHRWWINQCVYLLFVLSCQYFIKTYTPIGNMTGYIKNKSKQWQMQSHNFHSLQKKKYQRLYYMIMKFHIGNQISILVSIYKTWK